MGHSRKKERGQALILIVLAIVGMVALTALAIDGGNTYSDRRHAQNAADTAALAAGLARIRQSVSAPVDAWRSAGYSAAATNGYQSGTNATVNVALCSDTGVTCPLPPQVPDANGALVATDPSEFVKVTITSTIRTYFAPVVGIQELTNQVDSIVRAIPAQDTQYFNGSPLASVMPHCKRDYPNWNSQPFVVGGSANITVTGAPMFDNSDCEPDFYNNLSNGGGSLDAKSGIWLRGTATNLSNIVQYPAPNDVKQHYGTFIDPNSYVQPQLDDQCAGMPKNPPIVRNPDGTYTASPGRYTGTFPGMSGGQTVYLLRGLYCLYNGMTYNTGVLTTDLPGGTPHVYDPNEGVLFYVPSGDIDLHGNATISIHAITTNTCPQSGENGLLIYLPSSNSNSVNIGGGSGSIYTGSIIAPASLVQIAGSSGSSSDTLTLETQIIGFSISIGGGGYININFNKCLTAMTRSNPELQPYK